MTAAIESCQLTFCYITFLLQGLYESRVEDVEVDIDRARGGSHWARGDAPGDVRQPTVRCPARAIEAGIGRSGCMRTFR